MQSQQKNEKKRKKRKKYYTCKINTQTNLVKLNLMK